MQIGVYGSGYLGTVISACLADFGTPVSCCHPDRTRMVEMAQGNIPFFEKNLKEIIRRNVRAGRLAYSTDIESFARKNRSDFPGRRQAGKSERRRAAHRAPGAKASDSDDRHARSRGHGQCAGKEHQGRRAAGHDRFAADVLHRWLRGGGFQLARPPDSGIDLE